MRPLVLFDLDKTLAVRHFRLPDWAASFRARFGLEAADELWLIELLAKSATPGQFEVVRARFGLAESADALWDGYCADIAAATFCPPDVLSGLEKLRAAGWRIGIASNGSADIQWAKLRATGIAGRVDAVCISGEAGARKPDPAIFAEAVRRCGGQSEGLPPWMVGNHPVNDIIGGRAAGLRTVWIDRGLTWPPELPGCPDHQVPDAVAAIDLLGSLQG